MPFSLNTAAGQVKREKYPGRAILHIAMPRPRIDLQTWRATHQRAISNDACIAEAYEQYAHHATRCAGVGACTEGCTGIDADGDECVTCRILLALLRHAPLDVVDTVPVDDGFEDAPTAVEERHVPATPMPPADDQTDDED